MTLPATVQRYSAFALYHRKTGNPSPIMHQRDDGDWVKHDDHLRITSELMALVAEVEGEAKSLRSKLNDAEDKISEL